MRSITPTLFFLCFVSLIFANILFSQEPTLVDPKLQVKNVISGLVTPTTIAFLGPDDFLILEKNTGQVKRVLNGITQTTLVDLAVNAFSERGLLGIALHPNFPTDPGVYLFWSCRTLAPPEDEFFPDQQKCSDENMFGADTEEVL